MNWHAGLSFCPSHLNSSVSADLTGNFLGISLIIPCRCVMHFKELSHHYLLSRELRYKNHQLLGKEETLGRGEMVCSRTHGRWAIQLSLVFLGPKTSEWDRGNMLWQERYRTLSSAWGPTVTRMLYIFKISFADVETEAQEQLQSLCSVFVREQECSLCDCPRSQHSKPKK